MKNRRTKAVTFRVTDEEYDYLDGQVEVQGFRSISELAREKCLGEMPRRRSGDRLGKIEEQVGNLAILVTKFLEGTSQPAALSPANTNSPSNGTNSSHDTATN